MSDVVAWNLIVETGSALLDRVNKRQVPPLCFPTGHDGVHVLYLHVPHDCRYSPGRNGGSIVYDDSAQRPLPPRTSPRATRTLVVDLIPSWSICDLNPQLPALNTRDPSDTRRIFSKLTQGHLRYPNGSRWPRGTTVSSAFSVVRWYYFMAPRLQRSNTPVGPLVPHGCMACEAAGHWNGEQRGSTR